MSVVSNYVILASSADDDFEDGEVTTLDEINSFFVAHRRADESFKPIGGCADGGRKGMEMAVFAGAFNHFDDEAFAAHLRTVRWQDPDFVRVFLKREHDERPREVKIIPKQTGAYAVSLIDPPFSELLHEPTLSRDDKIALANHYLAIVREGEGSAERDEHRLREVMGHIMPLIGGASQIAIPPTLFAECCALLTRRRMATRLAVEPQSVAPSRHFVIVDRVNGADVTVAYDLRLSGQQWAMEKRLGHPSACFPNQLSA